ncbi:hypothetical protein BKA69DRAFT_1093888 [Paraphysoderma sedebokerense]|nr:hypothetical protein BKA69DRAFT_1093888 [Paraphysoderma sedebokerense]
MLILVFLLSVLLASFKYFLSNNTCIVLSLLHCPQNKRIMLLPFFLFRPFPTLRWLIPLILIINSRNASKLAFCHFVTCYNFVTLSSQEANLTMKRRAFSSFYGSELQ